MDTQNNYGHPWDALDVDDSSLRQCKQRRRHTTTDTSSPSSWNIIIPGPARAVQLAVIRKSREEHVTCSTQDYVNRVIREEEMGSFDEDFTKEPWTWALEFLTQEGLVDDDGVLITTRLESVKQRFLTQKIDWVVAIVQSCNPNGLGDLLVTLKDPTGTIEASIHHGTSEGEFCRDISVGSVLILQKVAVFAPSRSASYLNIAENNVVKVINKDSGPPVKQKGNESVVEDLAYSSSGCREKFLLQVLPPSQRGTAGIMNNLIQTDNVRASANNENEVEGTSAAWHSSINQTATIEKESQLVKQDVISGTGLEIEEDDDLDVLMEEHLNHASKTGKEGASSSRVFDNAETNCINSQRNSKDKTIDHVEVKTQTINPTGCLPEWTDEQLDELLAFD